MRHASHNSTCRERTRPSVRSRLRSEEGLTLIEVVVSALMLGLVSLSLVGLDAIGSSSADQQRRSQASELAQQDQERMRAMSSDQLQNLNQTRTVTVDKVQYTVVSTAQFLSSSSGSGACTASGTTGADYARITSAVDWNANNRTPVTQQTVITPPRGGSLLTQVVDQNNAPIQGATVTATGTDESTDSLRRRAGTDATGCAIFGGLLPGDYSVAAVFNGYVDADGDPAPTNNVTATAGNTATSKFTIGNPGSATAAFWTRINSANITGQRAPSLSWGNSGMAAGFAFVNSTSLPASVTTPKTLFPFITTGTGVYTNNYTLWAGRCNAAKPPSTANQATATVAPGTTTGVARTGSVNGVQMPALDIEVRFQNASTTTRVSPDRIRLTDSCGQTWFPAIRSDAATSTSGSLSFPGQPYGATYSICADDQGYRRIQSATNTDFTNGTTVLMTIDSRSSSNAGTC